MAPTVMYTCSPGKEAPGEGGNESVRRLMEDWISLAERFQGAGKRTTQCSDCPLPLDPATGLPLGTPPCSSCLVQPFHCRLMLVSLGSSGWSAVAATGACARAAAA